VRRGPKPVSQEQAFEEAAGAGLEPCEPYPGRVIDPWMHRCMTCHMKLNVPLTRIRGGKKCSHWSFERLLGYRRDILKAGFELVGSTPVALHEEVRMRCVTCKKEVWQSVAQTRRRPCTCARDELFVQEMRDAGLEPKVPFPGTSRAPWPSVCTECGQDRKTSLDTVRSGKRCKHGETWPRRR